MPLLEHAAGCGTCSELLREAIAILHPELAGEAPEQALMSSPPLRGWRQRWAGAMAIAASLLVTATAALWWPHEARQAPLHMLARSYGQQRPFVLRLPSAPPRRGPRATRRELSP
ncbi:MAG: hypothetical protein IPJ98_31080 [Bryobacterales bacterium]|nr:hypothetical protein [Bryobacterales bacterium]